MNPPPKICPATNKPNCIYHSMKWLHSPDGYSDYNGHWCGKYELEPIAETECTDYVTLEGIKHDHGKIEWDLLPYDTLEEVVKIFMHGKEKYGLDNWRKGFKYSRIFSAIMRHLTAFWNGENIDLDSGFHHLAHAEWNILALRDMHNKKYGIDDRTTHGDDKTV